MKNPDATSLLRESASSLSKTDDSSILFPLQLERRQWKIAQLCFGRLRKSFLFFVELRWPRMNLLLFPLLAEVAILAWVSGIAEQSPNHQTEREER